MDHLLFGASHFPLLPKAKVSCGKIPEELGSTPGTRCEVGYNSETSLNDYNDFLNDFNDFIKNP